MAVAAAGDLTDLPQVDVGWERPFARDSEHLGGQDLDWVRDNGRYSTNAGNAANADRLGGKTEGQLSVGYSSSSGTASSAGNANTVGGKSVDDIISAAAGNSGGSGGGGGDSLCYYLGTQNTYYAPETIDVRLFSTSWDFDASQYISSDGKTVTDGSLGHTCGGIWRNVVYRCTSSGWIVQSSQQADNCESDD